MKRRSLLLVGLCLLALLGTLPAQEKKSPIAVFHNEAPDERASTRILYWNQEKDGAAGQVVINYGRPLWKKDYENPAVFALGTNGKVWRLGSNYWTTLDSNLPLKIAGKEIPAGIWYVGLHRSNDGATWSLALIDPAKARSARLDAFEIGKAPVEFKIPVTLEKATETKERLTIMLTPQKESLKDGRLSIAWGTLQLSAPIQVAVTP